jgi:hypothetical protein
VAGSGRRQYGRYLPVPLVIVLHSKKMLVRRSADGRSTDCSERVLGWIGPQTKTPASGHHGRDAIPGARR